MRHVWEANKPTRLWSYFEDFEVSSKGFEGVSRTLKLFRDFVRLRRCLDAFHRCSPYRHDYFPSQFLLPPLLCHFGPVTFNTHGHFIFSMGHGKNQISAKLSMKHGTFFPTPFDNSCCSHGQALRVCTQYATMLHTPTWEPLLPRTSSTMTSTILLRMCMLWHATLLITCLMARGRVDNSYMPLISCCDFRWIY